MRPILMSSSSSSSTNSLQQSTTPPQQYNQSSNRNTIHENNKTDNCISSHELNKNYNNNDLNDNSRLGIYCTLRLPQQQQQQQQQQTINNDLISNDRKILNCSTTINQENLNSIIKNNDHHHHQQHQNLQQQPKHHNQQQYNINIDEDSDEDNLRLLDNTKKESSMLKHQIQKNEDQHEFDLNDASLKIIDDSSSKNGTGNFYGDKNYMIGSGGGSNHHRDTDYNNGNKEIYCSTAFLRLKDTDKNVVELPYPVQDSSSSSDEQTTLSTSTSLSFNPTTPTATTTEYTNRNPLDLLSYCTMSKKLKQMITPLSSSNIYHHHHHLHNPNIICDLSSSSTSTINNLPYQKLKESELDLMADELKNSNLQNYGLSNNLSTESLKNACDCYDLTDDDDDDDDNNDQHNNMNSNYTNRKDFFINNNNNSKQNNSLKRRNSLKIINNDNKFSSNNNSNYNNTSDNSKEQQQLPNNKKTTTSSKIVNNNCLLQKLEHGLNELKKCEKNQQQNTLKQKQQNQLKNHNIKSQSLDRKRSNSSNHRTTTTTRTTNQRSTNMNNLVENNEQMNQQQQTTTSATTISNGHPSYCTMKRDRNINNSNFQNQNNLKFENNSIKLPTTNNYNLNISTLTNTNTIPFDTTTTLSTTQTMNTNQINDNDNDQQIVDKYFNNNISNDESSLNLQQPSSHNNQQYASLTTEAFNILNELDEILANTETAISRTASICSTSPSSSTNKLDFDFDNINQNQNYNNNLFLITNNDEIVCNIGGTGTGIGVGDGGGGVGGKISPIQNETTTEKIEDCLFELDEYLDEIDRQTPKLYRDSSEDDYLGDDDDYKHHLYRNIKWINDEDDDEDDEYYNQETLKRSKTLPKKLLRRQYLNDIHLNLNDNLNEDGKICNSVGGGIDGKNKNNNKNNKKFMTIDRKVELLQRGHILRNTIAGLRHKIAKVKLKQNNNNNDSIESKLISNTIQSSNLCDFTMNGGSQPGTPINSSRKAWRRNSMRKTSLINLPDNFQQNSLPLPFLPPPPLFPVSSQSTSSIVTSSNSNRNKENNFNDLEISDQQKQIDHLMDPFSNFNEKSNSKIATTESETSHQNNHNSLPVDVHINSNIRRSLSENDGIQEPPQQQLDDLNGLDLVHDIINNTTLQDSSNESNENENLGASGNTENSNLIEQQQRPRQVGRRAEAHPRILSITTETTDTGHRIIVNHDRPVSAPAAISAGRRQIQSIISPLSGVLPSSATSNDATNRDRNAQDNSQQQQQARFIGSEASSIGSSRNPSPVSIISSTGSSSLNSTNTENQTNSESHHRQQSTTAATISSGTRTSPLDPDLAFQVQTSTGINSFWPHSFSRILALLCCTLGLFNISRFSVQTVHYGGNFLIQFLILSIIFGIPMFWLQMCLGSKIRSGPVSMWKISPICRGIGISLCLAQCVIALYSTISLAWILVYFRDSFVKRDELYRWQEAFYIYRRQAINFTTTNLTETIADYFNGVVLQRWQLGLGRRIETGGVRFQLAFNLAIIWTLVFIILCKGLKSFGKLVVSLTVIPLVLFFIVTCQLLYIIDFSSVQNIFSASDFEDFLVNSKTWIAAAQETFLTWVLLSPSVISITSRSNEKDISKTVLRRDAIIVVLLTLFGLSLAAVFGYACIHILQNHGYFYIPGSYENMDSYLFLFNYKNQMSPILSSIPIKWIPHYSSVLGETYRRQSAATQLRESGYEPLRLCTELFPAVVAVAQDQISSVFTVLGFLAFLFFGLAQLCAIWKPISSALGNSSSSVLLSCVTGLLLGIPFATEMGLSIIHYLDLVIGGAWWLPILWTAQIFGVFLIRGRPYNGDLLVNDLKMAGSMSAFLALSWNVLLPIGLVSLSVIQYKVSGSNQFYYWRGKSYFNFWARKVGGLIQVGFLLIVPLTAIVQIYRYLNKGPPDILDRIQNLYRPSQSPLPSRRPRPTINRPTSGQSTTISSAGNNGNINVDNQTIQDDAPPKYTPPPSYTTATGARLAKIFRQSIRRSVRRILGESSRTRPILHTSPTIDNILPPEYSTVLTDPSGLNSNDNENIEIGPRVLYNSNTNRNISSIERQRRRFTDTNIEIINRNQTQNTNNTIFNRPNSAEQTTTSSATSTATRINNLIPFSASDVAQVLRTNRHERSASALATRVVDHALRSSSLRCKSSRSVENLVLNAAPLGESSAIALNYQNDDDNFSDNNRNNDERTSVI